MAVWISVVLWVFSLSLAAGVRQNVAEGKPAWMSTTRQASQSAGNAVDGETTATNERYSVHTKVNETTAWWKVDLQTQVQSAEVKIYFRTDYKSRRNGLQLYTSVTNSSAPKTGTICHTVSGRPNGTDIPDVLNVTCSGTWHYLTVYTDTDNDGTGAILDFVEVQVWTCASGRYGDSCSMDCNSRHCDNTGDSCPFDTGACSWCQTGWAGPDCTACTSGFTYGDNCSKYCSSRHCRNTGDSCPPNTGACSSAGCQTGWTGPDCTTCTSGFTYGDNCSKYCSSRHCRNTGDSCPPATGACSECLPGWARPDCTVCVNGYYGASCNQLCSNTHCKSPTTCRGVQWRCVGGCAAGYHGQYCTQTCAPGYYGGNCDQSCAARHCKMDSSCDVTHGRCVDGCAAGYHGIDCRQKCIYGMYGEGCNKSCSSRHCKTPSTQCDHMTGSCPDGCITGFTGDDCLQNCPDGYYGTTCSLSCADRHCSSTSCPADGACDAECEVGWTLQSCTQECPRGKYGTICNSVCGHCADNITCHHITGTCPGGCQAGWKLPLCQTVCDNGKFGLNCESDCGQCNGTCDAVDGRCPWGCAEGYSVSYCSAKLPSMRDSDSTITPVTAGVIGLAAGICLTVVLGVGLFMGLVRQGRLQWKNSSQKDEVKVRATSTQVDRNSTQPSDNFTSISEQTSGRDIYNNDYSTLDVEAKSNNDYDVIKNKAYENM